jgi:hypothetical protein
MDGSRKLGPIPIENAIEDAVLTAVRKWRFGPQNVEGIPAQVATKLIIPFPGGLQNAPAEGPDVKPIFNRIRAAGSLRLDGAPGFHMKASFGTPDSATKGTYEETWVSPTKWRREVKLNDSSIVEVRTEDAFYRTFPGKYASRLADDVVDSLSFSLPGDHGSDLHDADWKTVNAKFSNLPVLRLSNGYINPQGKPDPLTVMYFVEEKTGYIRGRSRYSIITVFNDLQPFGEKSVARKLTVLGGDVTRMDITVDTLEPATDANESVFRVAGAKPVFTSADEDGRFTQPRAVYTAKPSLPG